MIICSIFQTSCWHQLRPGINEKKCRKLRSGILFMLAIYIKRKGYLKERNTDHQVFFWALNFRSSQPKIIVRNAYMRVALNTPPFILNISFSLFLPIETSYFVPSKSSARSQNCSVFVSSAEYCKKS